MEAATLRSQKKKQNVAIVEWASTPKKNVNKKFFAQPNSWKQKIFRGKRNDNKKIKKL